MVGLVAATAATIRKLIGLSINQTVEEAKELVRTQKTPPEHQRKLEELMQKLLAAQSELRDLKHPITEFPGRGLGTFLATQTSKPVPKVEPFLPDGGFELVVPSNDDYSIKFYRFVTEGSDMKGVMMITNDRLSAIGRNTIIIRTARSFDSRHNDYRDGRAFGAFSRTEPNAVEAGCSGKPTVLVRKTSSVPDLMVGNDDQNPLKWPENDNSKIHKWLLNLTVDALTVEIPNRTPATPLAPINVTFVLVWDTEQNEFFIEPPPASAPTSA